MLLFLVGLSLIIGGAHPASAETRVALVIGNSTYESADRLANPDSDATAIAESLRQLDFTTVVHESNLDYREFRRSLSRFSRLADGADIALIYYAGHGIEVDKRNYLVPVDAELRDVRDVDLEAMPLDVVMGTIEGARKLRLVILDACRNSPFRSRMTRPGGPRSVGRGLSRVDAPSNTLVAFAAREGTTADDGTGKHSPFTAALLEHIETPGLEINFLFRRVRDRVVETTDGRQEPFTYGSLSSEAIYLKSPKPEGVRITPLPPPDPALQAWNAIRDTQRVSDLELFIKRFPDSFYAELAQSRLTEIQVAVGVLPEKPEPSIDLGFQIGEEFQDCSSCPMMVVVPPGSYLMGSPASEAERSTEEGPRQRVTLSTPFAVGKFETTLDQFHEFVAETGHKTGNTCWTFENFDGKVRTDRSYLKPGISQDGSEPVVCVNWHDAKAYVSWLMAETGKRYRLLSEAEWEYVARAGMTTPFSTGETITTSQANFNGGTSTYNGSKRGAFRNKTTRVGSYRANAFKLHDLHGNVIEWVEDCWNPDLEGVSEDHRSAADGDCSERAMRGGSWGNPPSDLRSARRFKVSPDYRSYAIGFRVARTLAP